MTLLDPQTRSAEGERIGRTVVDAALPPAATLLDASWRDYVYAEIWSRPALDLRARFLISIAGAAGVNDADATERYVRGALAAERLSLAELREAALHVAVYSGWTCGGLIDVAVSRVAAALNLAEPAVAPIRAAPWDPAERIEQGRASFLRNMLSPEPPPTSAYFEAGILNFVFGEMWNRPGLDQRSRRWLTLVGVGNSSTEIPIKSHVWSAMTSGNATRAEMLEFVLQYAVHAGWPRASVMQGAVLQQADRVEKGLPFEP